MRRTAKIASRNNRSLYSYLFREGQYSKFFELAAENLFEWVLEQSADAPVDADMPVQDGTGEGAVPPEHDLPLVDLTEEHFDPFNVGFNN